MKTLENRSATTLRICLGAAGFALALSLPSLSLAQAALAQPGDPAHPNLLYSTNDLAAMRAKIEKYDWARQAWKGVKADADAVLKTSCTRPVVCE
jgi:hypothetical protein